MEEVDGDGSDDGDHDEGDFDHGDFDDGDDLDENDESSGDVTNKDHVHESKSNLSTDSPGNHSGDQSVPFFLCRVRPDSPVRERERGTFSFYQASSSNFQSQTLQFVNTEFPDFNLRFIICNNSEFAVSKCGFAIAPAKRLVLPMKQTLACNILAMSHIIMRSY